MGVANDTGVVDDEERGHAAKLEQVDLLFVARGNARAQVGQAGEGDIVFGPVALECVRAIRAQGQDGSPQRGEFCMALAQLRQMRAAVGSDKPAQQDQHNQMSRIDFRKADQVALNILELKIRSYS